MDAILMQTATYPPPPPTTSQPPPTPPPTSTAGTGADLAMPVTGLGACLVLAVVATAIGRRRTRHFENK